MSLSKSTVGDDYIRQDNIRAKKPKSGYTAAVGDLVVQDATVADGVDRGASDENPYGIVLSINSGNGTLSVAELKDGTTLMLEYTSTAPAIGQKIECNGDRGTILSSRDRVRLDNTNGIGWVVGVDASSPGGTGTLVVRFV
jgi:hypothetical protein